MTSLESKTKCDIYGNVKEIINDAISIIPWMTEDRIKCAERRKNHKIRNKQQLDKKYAE